MTRNNTLTKMRVRKNLQFYNITTKWSKVTICYLLSGVSVWSLLSEVSCIFITNIFLSVSLELSKFLSVVSSIINLSVSLSDKICSVSEALLINEPKSLSEFESQFESVSVSELKSLEVKLSFEMNCINL